MADTQTWDAQQEDLALRLMTGDEDALRDVLRHLAPSVMSCLRGKYQTLLSAEDIEDVVSMALRDLWEYRHKYDDRKASLWTIYYLFADRTAQDLISSGWQQMRRRERTNRDALMERLLAPAALPLEGLDGEDGKGESKAQTRLCRDVREALATLPEDHRRILIAKAMAPDGEVTAGMLGQELAMPAGTVRVNLHRAKLKMQHELARRGHKLSAKGGRP